MTGTDEGETRRARRLPEVDLEELEVAEAGTAAPAASGVAAVLLAVERAGPPRMCAIARPMGPSRLIAAMLSLSSEPCPANLAAIDGIAALKPVLVSLMVTERSGLMSIQPSIVASS